MLVEIIIGKKTGDAALATAIDYVRAIKKTPIVVNDSRGFYTSRVVDDLHRRRPAHAARRRAGGDDRERRQDGRHAGRPAGAERRGRDRPDAQDHGRDQRPTSAPRPCPGPVEADRRAGGKRGRLGRKNGKGFYDYPRRPGGKKRLWPGLAESCKRRRSRRAGFRRAQAAPSGHPGAGGGALLRGGRRHRSARGRCRLDPRLRLRALYRRHAVLHRRHGRGQSSSISASASPRPTARASGPTGCCATWPRTARPSTAASRRPRRNGRRDRHGTVTCAGNCRLVEPDRHRAHFGPLGTRLRGSRC